MSRYEDIKRSVRDFDSAPEFDPYSKVVITVSSNEQYVAGNDTGRTLSLECPWGTQRMANNLLLQIQGYKYQPFTANGALVSPAVELGDGITVNGIRSRVFTQDLVFNNLLPSKIEAPEGEELDHEYPYFSSRDRRVQRQLSNVQQNQNSQAEQLEAKLPKVGGSADVFGWTANEAGWTLSVGGVAVLKIDATGLQIAGVSNISPKTLTFTDGAGVEHTINYLAWEE